MRVTQGNQMLQMPMPIVAKNSPVVAWALVAPTAVSPASTIAKEAEYPTKAANMPIDTAEKERSRNIERNAFVLSRGTIDDWARKVQSTHDRSGARIPLQTGQSST
jgi:hypothetical protein